MTLKLLKEPELETIEGSEIDAAVDMEGFGTDNRARPIMVGQDGTDFLNLTLEDAERLYAFLKDAIVYVKEERLKITQ